MEEKRIVFKEYIEAFKNLHDESKKETLIKELKELIAVFDEFAKEDNISLEYMHSNEINDLNKPDATDADFLEAMFVYTLIAKDVIGQYLIKKEGLSN